MTCHNLQQILTRSVMAHQPQKGPLFNQGATPVRNCGLGPAQEGGRTIAKFVFIPTQTIIFDLRDIYI